jgi:pantothenate kinase
MGNKVSSTVSCASDSCYGFLSAAKALTASKNAMSLDSALKYHTGADDDTTSTASGVSSDQSSLPNVAEVLKVHVHGSTENEAKLAAGKLAYYDEDQRLPVLEIGDVNTGSRALVCMTGLADGFLSIEYLPALAEAAKFNGFRTVQPVHADVADMDAVLSHLRDKKGIKEIVLFGYSSRCKDILRFMQAGAQASMVSGIILQASETDGGEGTVDPGNGCFIVPVLLVASSDKSLSQCLANPMLGDAEVVSLATMKSIKGSESPQIAKVCAAGAAFLRRVTGMEPAPLVLSWECEAVQKIRALRSSIPAGRPVMVGLVGIPGSGKSTSATMIAKMLGERAALIPMDGYHQTKAELAARPDAKDATYRRGAPDTFDPAALKASLSLVVDPNGPENVFFPGFDHAVGDPCPDEHKFSRAQHDFAVVEGIYLLHDKDGFEGTHEFFDLTVYLERDIDKAVSQLKIRNRCIPGYTPEEIDVRCEVVDRKNAETVQFSRRRSSLCISPSEY